LQRKSPRLDFARSALIGTLEEWHSQPHSYEPVPTRRFFNPNAPSFMPSPSIPPVPPNSLYTNPSPLPLSSHHTSPRAEASHHSHHSTPIQPHSHPHSPDVNVNVNQPPASGRPRTMSGGMKIGNGRVIEFGDFPEPVDLLMARERAERGRMEGRRGEGERSGERDMGPEGLGIRGAGMAR